MLFAVFTIRQKNDILGLKRRGGLYHGWSCECSKSFSRGGSGEIKAGKRKIQLGSVEYAAEHLGSNLIVVLGHTHCGAVGAAISNNTEGYIKSIAGEIKLAIGDEKDDYKACCLNVEHSIKKINDNLHLPEAKVIGAVYHIEDGHVEFM